MKFHWLGLFAYSVGLAMPAAAVTSRVGSAQDLGVGAAIGQPMGVTAKYWLSSTSAIDAFMGYHISSNFDLHADYLVHTYSTFDITSGRLPMYVGLGARINAGNDTHFGLRIPLGAAYLFPTAPVEIFAEVAPVVKFIDYFGADIDGQLGLRVYLNYLK